MLWTYLGDEKLKFNPNLLSSPLSLGYYILSIEFYIFLEMQSFCEIFLQGSGSAAQGEISFLSWNSKVQHILASTSYNGTTGEGGKIEFLHFFFPIYLCLMYSIYIYIFSSGLGPKEAKTSN